MLGYIVSAVTAYLLGSLSFGIIFSKLKYKKDIRDYGSNNAGMTNMLRTFGKGAAALVFLFDTLKGAAAVLIAKYLLHFDGDPTVCAYTAMVFVVLGHLFPLYFGFRGGKGVATLVGAIMGVNAPLVLLCFGVWFLVLMITHYVSLASMVAGCSFPIFTLISPKVNLLVPFVVFSFIIAVLLIYTHRKNIERLKAGTESKIYIWKPRHVKQQPPKQEKKEE